MLILMKNSIGITKVVTEVKPPPIKKEVKS